MTEKLFYTIPEAAAALGVAPRTVRRMIAEKRLPAVRMSARLLRIPVNALASAGTPLN